MTRQGGDVRATDWKDFVGQEALKRRLDIRIAAALNADRPLDHVLLTAPPGFGKTTLASMIAQRLGRAFKPFVAPVSIDVLAETLLEHQGEPLVIFLDEVHLATKREQEDLLTLLEEGYLQHHGDRVEHNSVTIIAGTTARDKVIPALYDRFPIRPVFADYTDADLGDIVMGMADRLGSPIPRDLAVELGRATAGTPRNARGLVSAARDLFESGVFPLEAADVLDLAGVEADGLNLEHVTYMRALASAARGKMGLNPIAARLQLRTTVVEQMERLLLRLGYVELAEGGRVLTDAGHARLARAAL